MGDRDEIRGPRPDRLQRAAAQRAAPGPDWRPGQDVDDQMRRRHQSQRCTISQPMHCQRDPVPAAIDDCVEHPTGPGMRLVVGTSSGNDFGISGGCRSNGLSSNTSSGSGSPVRLRLGQ